VPLSPLSNILIPFNKNLSLSILLPLPRVSSRHSQYLNETDVIGMFANVCACVYVSECVRACARATVCVCVCVWFQLLVYLLLHYCLILVLLLVGFVTVILLTPNHLQAIIYCIYIIIFMLTIIYCIILYVYYSVSLFHIALQWTKLN